MIPRNLHAKAKQSHAEIHVHTPDSQPYTKSHPRLNGMWVIRQQFPMKAVCRIPRSIPNKRNISQADGGL